MVTGEVIGNVFDSEISIHHDARQRLPIVFIVVSETEGGRVVDGSLASEGESTSPWSRQMPSGAHGDRREGEGIDRSRHGDIA